LELVGNDHPGIVQEVSRALAQRAVNIEELTTERTSAPYAGNALFRAKAQLRLPEGLDIAELRGLLEAIADDIMVDLTVAEI
jgi:glycine cleavage system regulatory protein